MDTKLLRDEWLVHFFQCWNDFKVNALVVVDGKGIVIGR